MQGRWALGEEKEENDERTFLLDQIEHFSCCVYTFCILYEYVAF